MIGLTHYAARDLLIAGPAELTVAERAALSAHLDQCPECQGYTAELSELRTALTHLFRQRWPPLPSQQMIDAAQVHVRKRQAQRRITRRINTLAFATGLVTVILALAWVLNRLATPGIQQAATPPTVTNSALPVLPPQTTSSAPKNAPGSQISLVSYAGAEERLWPGSSFTLTLRWQTGAPLTASYQAFVHILDDQGNLVASSDGTPGGRGTTTWTIGEIIDDVHALSLPDSIKPGPYSIVAGLYDQQSGARVRFGGQDSVRLMTITVQAPQQSIQQDFGGFARLLGVDGITTTVFAGEAVPLTFYWRSLATTASSYKVSLQVFSANKGLVAQAEGIPGNGTRPTSTWQPGETIVDSHTLQLPPDLPPGEYRLLLLMFDASNGAQVLMGDGNGAITLATFAVPAKSAAASPNPIELPACPITLPNGNAPPDEVASPEHHGNGALWTVLWPAGNILIGLQDILPDGSLSMKFMWWRGVKGQLTIAGQRLDADAPPLRADIPDGYGDSGVQASTLIFPAEGCWEVTGRVGDAALTFVTRVTRVIP